MSERKTMNCHSVAAMRRMMPLGTVGLQVESVQTKSRYAGRQTFTSSSSRDPMGFP